MIFNDNNNNWQKNVTFCQYMHVFNVENILESI
jgi:hypothetical protein